VTQTNDVHGAVREHYGALARAAGTGCCGDTRGSGGGVTLYDSALLAGAPTEAALLSLGCGDPVTIAGLRPGERVLDLGSGAGLDCFLAARQVGPTGRVIGVDMTPDMLARANASKARLGLDYVEFRQGQIEALPVEDASVDVVISNCVINLSPDKAAVFREVLRVLTPGGRAAISDIVTEGEFSPEARTDMAQWSACVSGAVDADAYRALLVAAGFEDVQIVDKTPAEQPHECCGSANGPRVYSARITACKPA